MLFIFPHLSIHVSGTIHTWNRGLTQDTILCDVVDMDASHLIFRRPWEYDVDAEHHGRNNSYEFTWLGKRIGLMPLPSSSKAFGNTFTAGKILFTAHERSLEQEFREAKLALSVLECV